MLNTDTEIVGDVIQKMIEFMEKPEKSGVGACNCNLYFPDGKAQIAESRMVTVRYMVAAILQKNIIKKIAPWFFGGWKNKLIISKMTDRWNAKR